MIDERKDLDSIKVEKLVGSFRTYELTLDKPMNHKFVALKTVWVAMMNLLTQIHQMRRT